MSFSYGSVLDWVNATVSFETMIFLIIIVF